MQGLQGHAVYMLLPLSRSHPRSQTVPCLHLAWSPPHLQSLTVITTIIFRYKKISVLASEETKNRRFFQSFTFTSFYHILYNFTSIIMWVSRSSNPAIDEFFYCLQRSSKDERVTLRVFSALCNSFLIFFWNFFWFFNWKNRSHVDF